MVSVVRRYEISSPEWERIKPYIPEEQEADSGEDHPKDSRTMLNEIFWILRSEAAGRDLPEKYGLWLTVYIRFMRWSKAGIFEKIFKNLAADADMQDISIDSTCIKALKANASAKKQKS